MKYMKNIDRPRHQLNMQSTYRNKKNSNSVKMTNISSQHSVSLTIHITFCIWTNEWMNVCPIRVRPLSFIELISQLWTSRHTTIMTDWNTLTFLFFFFLLYYFTWNNLYKDYFRFTFFFLWTVDKKTRNRQNNCC